MKLNKEIEFLRESNYMEGERSIGALVNAKWAWKYAKNYKGKYNTRFYLEVHKRLMARLNPRIAGKIRNIPVEVTNGRYECARPEEIISLLKQWEKMKWDLESEIEDSHLALMIIHANEDGNGRTGRITMNSQRVRKGKDLFVLKARDKRRYYGYHLPKYALRKIRPKFK